MDTNLARPPFGLNNDGNAKVGSSPYTGQQGGMEASGTNSDGHYHYNNAAFNDFQHHNVISDGRHAVNGNEDVDGNAKKICVNQLGHKPDMESTDKVGTGRFRKLFARHRLKTLTYCAVFWSFGMGIAFLGPTLLDLECRIGSVFSSMSWVFFSQALFTLVGSACGGVLVQRLGSHVVLLCAVFMLAVTLLIVPECTVLISLMSNLAVMGFFMGIIDTVSNISMLHLYGRDVAPFMQALHFCYGLGAFLSPIVTKPFLLHEDCNNLVLNSTDTNRMLNLGATNFSEVAKQGIQKPPTNSRIQFGFWIMSALQLPVLVLLLILVYRDIFSSETSPDTGAPEGGKDVYELRGEGEPNTIDTPIPSRAEGGGLSCARSIAPDLRDDEDRPHVTTRQVVMVTACTAGLLFIYDGLQSSFGGYIYSYAVKSIQGLELDEAAYLNACFWGTFAFGRLMSIGIATRITPQWMMLGNMTGCLIAMVMMLSMPTNHAMLYIGTCLFGTFMSSVFPTAVSMTETYIHVTSQITSVLVMTAAVGEMVLPVAIGHEFDAVGPRVLLVSGVVLTAASFALYVALYCVAGDITRLSSERSLEERLKAFLNGRASPAEGVGLMTHSVKYYSRMRPCPSNGSIAETSLSAPKGPAAL